MAELKPEPLRGMAVQDLTGTTVGRFAVRKLLGVGGMGEVYRAEDTKLKRQVALKRVSPEAGSDPTYRQRFLKEAQRASALSSPHIAAVYDVLEQNGEIFVVMEYVEGHTLRERMNQPLSRPEFFDIAIQCADALAAAHQERIVHCDIKPENIMLTRGGKVKILDFGVAKRLPHCVSGETTETSDSTRGGFSGTPAYMAPEVLLEREFDGRADIFSLGVVLYEALTGEHPFRAESFMATCVRIVREAPRPVLELRPDAPPELENLFARMLVKSPAERFGSAAEMLSDLRQLQSGTGFPYPLPRLAPLPWPQARMLAAAAAVLVGASVLASLPVVQERVKSWLGFRTVPQAKHVVVLPFTPVGDDPKTQVYADGLVEILTAKLTQLTGRSTLQVVPASEVRAKSVRTAEQARSEFGVNLVIEGSYLQSGDTVRVSYTLMDLTTKRATADVVTTSAPDPFGLQDHIVRGVVGMLELELAPQEQRLLAPPGTQVASAYDFYVQGRGYLWNYDRPENIDHAIGLFGRALQLDPNYALAYTGLGEAYWTKYDTTHDPKWVEPARRDCEQALKLDRNLAAAHICLGKLLSGTGRYAEAVAEWQRAAELEPTSDNAYRGLGLAYEQLGRLQEAENTYRRAIELRRHYWAGYNWLGAFYFRQTRYPEAIEMFREVVALAPDSFLGYSNLGGVYVVQSRYADAIEVLERSVGIRTTARAYTNLGTAYFYLRRFADAARSYKSAAGLDERNPVHRYNLGEAYYWAPGRRAEAASAYRKAIELVQEKLKINPKDAHLLGVAAVCHAMLGEKAAALARLNRGLALAPHDVDLRFKSAVVYMQFDETERAVRALKQAVGAGLTPAIVRDTPNFNRLRTHPGFKDLLQEK